MAEWTKRQQKAHRKAWVKALRSGKYKQTKGRLRSVDDGGMCCLGVGCDISKLGKWSGDSYLVGKGGAGKIVLDFAVQEWLGLSSTAGDYKGGHLDGLNDSGVPFDKIADIIESEPEGLVAK